MCTIWLFMTRLHNGNMKSVLSFFWAHNRCQEGQGSSSFATTTLPERWELQRYVARPASRGWPELAVGGQIRRGGVSATGALNARGEAEPRFRHQGHQHGNPAGRLQAASIILPGAQIRAGAQTEDLRRNALNGSPWEYIRDKEIAHLLAERSETGIKNEPWLESTQPQQSGKYAKTNRETHCPATASRCNDSGGLFDGWLTKFLIPLPTPGAPSPVAAPKASASQCDPILASESDGGDEAPSNRPKNGKKPRKNDVFRLRASLRYVAAETTWRERLGAGALRTQHCCNRRAPCGEKEERDRWPVRDVSNRKGKDKKKNKGTERSTHTRRPRTIREDSTPPAASPRCPPMFCSSAVATMGTILRKSRDTRRPPHAGLRRGGCYGLERGRTDLVELAGVDAVDVRQAFGGANGAPNTKVTARECSRRRIQGRVCSDGSNGGNNGMANPEQKIIEMQHEVKRTNLIHHLPETAASRGRLARENRARRAELAGALEQFCFFSLSPVVSEEQASRNGVYGGNKPRGRDSAIQRSEEVATKSSPRRVLFRHLDRAGITNTRREFTYHLCMDENFSGIVSQRPRPASGRGETTAACASLWRRGSGAEDVGGVNSRRCHHERKAIEEQEEEKERWRKTKQHKEKERTHLTTCKS
ncbi:hypothetical protein DFH09DRAFT_1092410 [Mycena vulgaris]|nr:hypothetical protein DFH09DRAFT_1092410 [Mycena vulgaris]